MSEEAKTNEETVDVKSLVAQERAKRIRACQAAISKALEENNCGLNVQLLFSGGGVRHQVIVTALE